MTNKNTKKALLTSVMSLLLCFTMLLGTTYAWFTDSVSSANNIIQSGNLDIELEYWNGEKWADVKDASDILTNKLWEPGVTEVAYLRVANAGTLALKYQLGINIVGEEKKGVNAAGETFKLSDYIQFGVVENVNGQTNAYANREAAVAAVTAAKKISAGYTKASSMAFGDELYLALVVYMPANVGNVANYKTSEDPANPDKYRPEIKLGINVIATQVASEEDSFNKYYDGATPWYGDIDTTWYNTTDTEFVIGTAEELAGLAQIVNNGTDSFAGKTIKLASNIDLNNLNWTPIGDWTNTFEGTFNGNGYTIGNLYINAPEGEGVGLFGVVQNATLTDIIIDNVAIYAYSMVAGVVGAAYPAIISDCHITGDVEMVSEWAYVAGIAGYCDYGTQVDACSVIADGMGNITSKTRNAVAGITAWLLEGNHKVTNCSVANLNLTGWTNVGGITGFVHYNNTIEGCSVKNVTLTKTRENGNPGIGLIAGGWSYNATNAITLRNNTVDTATLEGTHVAYAAYNELYGSEYGGATTSNFVLDNNVTENITNNLVEVAVATPATIQDMINNAAAGEAILLGAGTYTNTIVMKSNITLVGSAGAIVHCINLNGSSNVTLKNITFDAAGAKVGYDGYGNAKQYANIISRDNSDLTIQGGNNIVIEDCTFSGNFNYGGAAIAFADQNRSGYGNITIKGCTFETTNTYYNIYTHYSGNNGYFVIEGCTFRSQFAAAGPIYLGRYQSSIPVVVKGNTFENATSFDQVAMIQDHSNYGVSFNAVDNTFGG